MATHDRSVGSEVRSSAFSPFVCACFTLNYIVGTGFLALPWAFYQGGWLLSGVAIVGVCVAANVGSDYLLSAMARAECIESLPKSNKRAKVAAGGTISLVEMTNEGTPLIVGEASCAAPPALDARDGKDDPANLFLGAGASVSKGGLLLVGERRIDVPELCRIFLGDWGFKGYAICVSAYLYGAQWSFTSVFGNAVALLVPSIGGRDPYALSVLIFALIVVPMSFLELSEQKLVQLILSGGRIVVIVLMILTPLVAAIFCRGSTGVPHFDDQYAPAGATAVEFSGVYKMMPVMVYAAIFHFSIPALSEEVAEKSQLGAVFGLTFLLCGSLYACIGLVNAWYFGDGVEQSANLNWETYHGGTGRLIVDVDEEPKWVDVALWARATSFFIVMFPAINVISAYPLHAFSLGNSLMGIYYGENIHKVEKNRRISSVFRAIACIPPLLGGLFVRDLGTITDFAGLAGLAIAFCFPALLYISSERKLRRMSISYRSHYERFGSSIWAAMVVLVFGVTSIVGAFASLLLKG